jgi:hypothetical protein
MTNATNAIPIRWAICSDRVDTVWVQWDGEMLGITRVRNVE